MGTKGEDEVVDLRFARTLDHILFFTNTGRVYGSRVYELPEGSRTSKGVHIANVLSLQPNESVTAMLTVEDFSDAKYITLLTRQGRIKRVEASAFASVRPSGLIAMNLDDNDALEWAQLTNGDQDFIIVTRGGKAVRFHEAHVRAMGRTAAGVWAIRLQEDDLVTSFDIVNPSGDLLVIHERGWGKRVPLEEYPEKGRYTQGVWTTDHRRLDETGPVVAARVVHDEDQITVITSNGIMLRTHVKQVSQMGRSTRGVRIVNLGADDSVAALAVIGQKDLVAKVDGMDDEGAEMGAPEVPEVDVANV
jgi:DNA gyrase subunit A